ncbi:MAG: hypothetical protein GX442_07960 [Candidatus Riflebacteria bacterium]|nr:hypothetical protein [Candidatus Riflebacteria bacterium]
MTEAPSPPPASRESGLLRPVVAGVALIEGVTALFRFGLGLESTRDTAATVGRLTGGIRIHHGYIGVLLLLIARRLVREGPARRWALILGWSLALSDLIHHFVVLWLATGSPQFDLVY